MVFSALRPGTIFAGIARPPIFFGALRLIIVTSLPRASEPYLQRCTSPHQSLRQYIYLEEFDLT
jgi:hypothetical protein